MLTFVFTLHKLLMLAFALVLVSLVKTRFKPILLLLCSVAIDVFASLTFFVSKTFA